MAPPNRQHTVELKLLRGGRDVLERRALHTVLTGTHEEIDRAIEALKPRGQLTPCPAVGTEPAR